MWAKMLYFVNIFIYISSLLLGHMLNPKEGLLNDSLVAQAKICMTKHSQLFNFHLSVNISDFQFFLNTGV